MHGRRHSTGQQGVIFATDQPKEPSLAAQAHLIERAPLVVYYIVNRLGHQRFQARLLLLYLLFPGFLGHLLAGFALTPTAALFRLDLIVQRRVATKIGLDGSEW